MSDSDVEILEPPEVEAVKVSVNSLVPAKSGQIYQIAYQKFIKWCEGRNVHNYTENVLLEYFLALVTSSKLKSSTLWSIYSMIKPLLNIKHGVDISKYLKLRAFLKKQNECYIPKKSRIFTKEQFERFLYEASDEKYLGIKIVFIIGICGGCRCEEMVNMKIDDIEDLGTLLYIKINDIKTNKRRSFTVVGDKFITIYRKYIALRPEGSKHQRFFVKYLYGKCHRSPMGIHKISSVPKEVASFLKLPNWKEYTGRSLRRTSTTLLKEGGGDITCITQASRRTERCNEPRNRTPSSGDGTNGSRNEMEVTIAAKRSTSSNADASSPVSWVGINLQGDKSGEASSPLVFIKTELGEVLNSHGSDHEIKIEEGDVAEPLDLGNPTYETYQNIVRENEDLKGQVQRLSSLLENTRHDLLLAREREKRLEQIVQAVRELVNKDTRSVVNMKLEI